MDDITIAIVAALLVKEKHGAASTSLQDAYTRVRDVLISTSDSADTARTFLASLEANPLSPARQMALYELLTTIPADQQATVLQLANDLIEQVMVRRHGTRIIQQLGVYHHGIVTIDGKVTGIAIGRNMPSLVFDEAARPPGNPVILAKPPKPPAGPPPPPTPTEDSPDV